MKTKFFKGTITVPPSKSYSHRALIAAWLYGGNINRVINILESDDITATRNAITEIQSGKEKIIIDCGESGTTFRLLMPICAALGLTVEFRGRGKLPERPFEDLKNVLMQNGIKFTPCNSAGSLRMPFIMSGKLIPGEYKIAGNVSSQYISGLLFALPLVKGESKLTVTGELKSESYVNMTKEVIEWFKTHEDIDYFVPGDYSAAAFWFAAGCIGGDLKLTGLDKNSCQGDKAIVEILKNMGGNIIEIPQGYHVKKSSLKGIEINAKDCPDIVPALCVAMAAAQGKSIIHDVQRLRIKESDRLEAVIDLLDKIGAKTETEGDKLIIYPIKKEVKSAKIKGYNDHRIVMSGAIASLLCKKIKITDTEAVGKSYPKFFEDYVRVGGKI